MIAVDTISQEKLSKEYSQEGDYTQVTYHQHMQFSERKEKTKELTEFVINHGVRKHIFDTRDMGVVSPEAQKWASEYFGKHVMATLAKGESFRCGIIVGKDIFAKVAAKNMSSAVAAKDSHFIVQYFTTAAEAKAWVCQ